MSTHSSPGPRAPNGERAWLRQEVAGSPERPEASLQARRLRQGRAFPGLVPGRHTPGERAWSRSRCYQPRGRHSLGCSATQDTSLCTVGQAGDPDSIYSRALAALAPPQGIAQAPAAAHQLPQAWPGTLHVTWAMTAPPPFPTAPRGHLTGRGCREPEGRGEEAWQGNSLGKGQSEPASWRPVRAGDTLATLGFTRGLGSLLL